MMYSDQVLCLTVFTGRYSGDIFCKQTSIAFNRKQLAVCPCLHPMKVKIYLKMSGNQMPLFQLNTYKIRNLRNTEFNT
jgi:hypothetical protein